MIDLRSDTFTVPTEEMRKVIANAEVGDDVFGEDPTVNELQEYTANLLGKEAALYVPSGVMSNQICIATLTNPGDEVIVESEAHIFYYEAAAPAIISQVQLRTLASENGMIKEDLITSSIRKTDLHFPKTSLICLENTHNRHGGTILDLEYLKRVRGICDQNNILLHCDGARIWNACIATGITPKEYAKPFDTLSVCLSKGLGAPVGSLVVSTKENIAKAIRWRKILGGAMRQVGIIASAGLYALKNHYELLPETHLNAKQFAKTISESELFEVDLHSVETNMVRFKTKKDINGTEFLTKLKEEGLLLLEIGKNTFRAVFHFQISKTDSAKAADILIKSLSGN